jgi:hypothetical protein
MSDWKRFIDPKSPLWAGGVVGYVEERKAELVQVCTDANASDAEIRAAQAGIKELTRLLGVPGQLQTSAKMAQKTGREARAGSY